MHLEFTEEQLSFQDSVRRALGDLSPPGLARSFYDKGNAGVDLSDLQKTFRDLGWLSMALPEDIGGLGLSFVETIIVAEELGRHCTPGPFFATACQFIPFVLECASAEQSSRLLAPVLEGQCGALGFAETGQSAFLGDVTMEASAVKGGVRLNGRKRYVLGAHDASMFAVVARSNENVIVCVTPRADVELALTPGVDPSLPYADIIFENVFVPEDQILSRDASKSSERALEQVHTTLAAMCVGACDRIFNDTLEYSKVRRQYGTPIGSFQALKHRFADMYLLLERARALVYFAAVAIAENDPRRTVAAAMAKAAAGDCQSLCVRDGLQMTGGIGFTWEHDLHLFLKRAKAADALLGTGSRHRRKIAESNWLDVFGNQPGVSTLVEGR